jgi:osmotically-inducible protein OsmY
MANDDRYGERNRGMFGYEGEGFARGYADLEGHPERGWNIGRDTERPSYRGRGPKNYQRADERIREDVCERLTMDHDVDATDVEVSVSDAVVTLNGTVPERHAKRIAEDICELVRGVKDVQNNLRVNRR